MICLSTRTIFFSNPNNASLKRNKYTKKYLFYKNTLLHLHKYVITCGVPTSQRTLLINYSI